MPRSARSKHTCSRHAGPKLMAQFPFCPADKGNTWPTRLRKNEEKRNTRVAIWESEALRGLQHPVHPIAQSMFPTFRPRVCGCRAPAFKAAPPALVQDCAVMSNIRAFGFKESIQQDQIHIQYMYVVIYICRYSIVTCCL